MEVAIKRLKQGDSENIKPVMIKLKNIQLEQLPVYFV